MISRACSVWFNRSTPAMVDERAISHDQSIRSFARQASQSGIPLRLVVGEIVLQETFFLMVWVARWPWEEWGSKNELRCLITYARRHERPQ